MSDVHTPFAVRLSTGESQRLPAAATAKLRALRGQQDDARAAGASAQARISELTKQLSNNPSDAAALEFEITRLKAVREQQGRRESSLGDLNAALTAWIQRQPRGALFVAVKTPTTKLLKGEDLRAAIIRIRNEIAELKVARRKTEVAPLPKAEVKERLRAHVEALAAKGRPTIATGRGDVTVSFANANDYGLSRDTFAAVLAWLFPDAMLARLEGQVAVKADNPHAVPASRRVEMLAAHDAAILERERQEEVLIERALDDGIDVLRRADASPLAILGIARGEGRVKPKARETAA